MAEISGWILYADEDYPPNRHFAAHMAAEARKRGFSLETALLSDLLLGIENNRPFCLMQGKHARPDFIISRQRDSLYSTHFEQMGIPVFNNAKVCQICNDKRKTYQFLQGFPTLYTVFPPMGASPPDREVFPVILKPADSHGGDRVCRVETPEAWREAAAKIWPQPLVQQAPAADPGKDLRVYVVFGEIIAGVMRTARTGYISNFKQGGQAALHSLSQQEKALTGEIIRRFEQAGAPLSFAGIDFLYHHGEPVFSEVEDVVGSRMLYQASDLDIAGLYWDKLANELISRTGR